MRSGAEFIVADESKNIQVGGQVVDVEESGARVVRFEDDSNLNRVGIVRCPRTFTRRWMTPSGIRPSTRGPRVASPLRRRDSTSPGGCSTGWRTPVCGRRSSRCT